MKQETPVFKIFSIIAYIRNFYKEEFFVTRKENGIKMKMLQFNNETKRYVEWIELIENKYDKIERIILGIWSENDLIEKYVIDKKPEYQLKAICRQIEKWPMLYGKINLKIQLYSYCELEIKGFIKKTEKWDIGNCKEYEIEGVKMYRKFDLIDSLENAHINNGIEINKDINGDKYINKSVNSDKGINSNKSFNNINSNKEVFNNINYYKEYYNENEKIIKCLCCINNNDGEMMQCNSCKNWIHTHCAGFFSNNDKRVPLYYKCVKCNGNFTMYQRNLAIYRRVLGIIYNENFENKNYLKIRLGISMRSIDRIFKQLLSDKFIEYENCIYNVQKTKEAKNKLKEYFCGVEMECRISIEDIELECE